MKSLILGPIVGGLTATSANLWGRSDRDGMLHAWLGVQPDLSDALLASTSSPLSGQDGFAGVAPLGNLSPNTCYYYSLTLDDSPPDPSGGPYPSFTTFPQSGHQTSFSFAFGSCFLPPDSSSGKIFEILDKHRQEEDLRFWLLIGDQIYADDFERNGIDKISVTVEDYRDVYQYSWSRPVLQKLLSNLPVFMTLDDHEVEDDWHWTDMDRTQATIPWWNRLRRWFQRRPLEERRFPRQRVLNALQAYWEHQAMHGPPFIKSPPQTSSGQYDLEFFQTGSLAYQFTYGAAAFFVMDTRSQRVKNLSVRIMLGEDQWQALESWLLTVKEDFPVKFIVTSGILLYRFFLDLPGDHWSGFPKERTRLLNFLADNSIDGVYFLAGDLHSAHAVRAKLLGQEGEVQPLWEFCSSPFAQITNPLSGILHNPFPYNPVRDVELSFSTAKNNFGLVRVNFSPRGRPLVRFEVYGEDDQLLGVAGD